jgi:RNA polymerase sigma factor (TIGR02999 family)
MINNTSGKVTRLLAQWSGGNADALEELFPLVYRQLRSLAAGAMRRERAGHTLQPTALVHEAYLRLTGKNGATVRDRAHFFAVAAQAMRRILVDHARRYQAERRFAPRDRVPIDKTPEPAVAGRQQVIAINDALNTLAGVNPRQAQVVELHYFGGMSNAETAEVLQVSVATVERDWLAARLWLRHQLERVGNV